MTTGRGSEFDDLAVDIGQPIRRITSGIEVVAGLLC
nr:MAG TPA: hypothetical protein [Caudoviricetes sp.]